MDNKLINKEDNNFETENPNFGKSKRKFPKLDSDSPKDRTVSRVVISKAADEALKILLDKVKDGFDGGEIERGDIVNWILTNHDKLIGESEIRTIRSLHFDEMLAWNRLTKLANQEGGLSEDLKAQFKSLLSAAAKKNKDAV